VVERAEKNISALRIARIAETFKIKAERLFAERQEQ